MRLHLGCGPDILDGWVNVDRVELPGVDEVHDVDCGPWPWPDGSASEIRAWNLFEHVADPVLFMVECHRVLEPGGRLLLYVPHWKSRHAYTDPTHRRYCTEETWDYWVPGTALFAYNAAYGGVSFTELAVRHDAGNMLVSMVKA